MAHEEGEDQEIEKTIKPKEKFVIDALFDSLSSDKATRMRGNRDLHLTESTAGKTVGKGRADFSRAVAAERPSPGDPDRKVKRLEITGDSNINEERIHSREEIARLIEGIAQQEGIDPRALEIETEIRDFKQQTIALRMNVAEEAARALGYARYTYVYMIKGRHNKTGVNETQIFKIAERTEDNGGVRVGGVVGVYHGGHDGNRGQWELSPGNWTQGTDDDIDPIES